MNALRILKSKIQLLDQNHKNIRNLSEIQKSFQDASVLIYKIFIPHFYTIIPHLKSVLNTQENLRSQNYLKDKDRNRFIICRALLKMILSWHTQQRTEIEVSVNKKPLITTDPPVHFNVSHSDSYALIAIADKAVGIDVEYTVKPYDVLDHLDYTFSAEDIQFLQSKKNKVGTFFNLWTRKEAFVKCIGSGIDDNFINIPSQIGVHKIVHPDAKAKQQYSIIDLDIDKNYIGALACETHNLENITVYTVPNELDILMSLSPFYF